MLQNIGTVAIANIPQNARPDPATGFNLLKKKYRNKRYAMNEITLKPKSAEPKKEVEKTKVNALKSG